MDDVGENTRDKCPKPVRPGELGGQQRWDEIWQLWIDSDNGFVLLVGMFDGYFSGRFTIDPGLPLFAKPIASQYSY